MEREIIAERRNVSNVSVIAVLFVVVLLSAMAIGVADQIGAYAWVMGGAVLAIDVVLVVFTVRMIVSVSRLPKVIALRVDDILIFLGEQTKFTAISQMDYQNARGIYGMKGWGKLTIFLNDGRTLRCDYVANVNHVHEHITRLKYEYAVKQLS